ncbi:unnamed protein product [Nezara viridula]|uniref:Uncharacterized protein n=1 Tax=Nezara viridula TaxID=85310 RepID=A0A9P0GZ56_NEZVI|nr:unnamed protein product [Nezara viridula]
MSSIVQDYCDRAFNASSITHPVSCILRHLRSDVPSPPAQFLTRHFRPEDLGRYLRLFHGQLRAGKGPEVVH